MRGVSDQTTNLMPALLAGVKTSLALLHVQLAKEGCSLRVAINMAAFVHVRIGLGCKASCQSLLTYGTPWQPQVDLNLSQQICHTHSPMSACT